MTRWSAWKETHARQFDFSEAVYRAMIAVNIALGVAIIVGGPERFPFPTYKPLLDLTHGSVMPWGLTILGAGVLMAFDQWHLNMLGLGIALLWMNIFSTMFFIAYRYDNSGSTAPIPYIGFAMVIVALLTNKVIDWRIKAYGPSGKRKPKES